MFRILGKTLVFLIFGSEIQEKLPFSSKIGISLPLPKIHLPSVSKTQQKDSLTKHHILQ